ncbi:MAG: hypothetical protein K6F34_03880 [Lachnospiraceae bacterium]|nr:hypothetical protein [Lachnospiraceae bacterium]
MNRENLRKIYKISKFTLFPLILLLIPFWKVNMGVDIADTTYSLGNYRDFGQVRNIWNLLTFIPSALGHLLTKLPFGNTMLGFNIYVSVLISLMALTGYRFFMTKMPGWLAFLSQLAVLGMCWAPRSVLYHYLTYFLLLFTSILIFRGLAGTNRTYCLFIAGVLVGLNTFVKFPGNVLHAALIIAVWFYGLITEKDFSDVFKETLLCIAGFIASFLLMILIISVSFGSDSFLMMINGTLGIAGSNSEYTMGQMILAIADAYLHGFKWAIYMILCILPGIPFFVLWPGKMIKVRKIVYCLCIAFLFFVLGRWGMYNFKFYQKDSALQWGAIFLLLSIGVDIWMLFTKQINNDWKLIGMLSLLNILILPLGSNNHIWPILNSLFFIAPVTFWMIYRFVRWGRAYMDETQKVPVFAVKAMSAGVVIAFFAVSLGLCACYVFMDGEDGYPRNRYITDNAVLNGMKTTEWNAAELSELSAFVKTGSEEFSDRNLLLYGNIPGLCYALDRRSALSTTWPDLDSYPVETMEKELEDLSMKIYADSYHPSKSAPLIITSSRNVSDTKNAVRKKEMIEQFIADHRYEEIYSNNGYSVYVITADSAGN